VVLANMELVEMMRVAQVPKAASFDKGTDRDDDRRGLVRDEEPRCSAAGKHWLRHQIGVLQCSAKKRPPWNNADRLSSSR
jgi:hypothetical protein